MALYQISYDIAEQDASEYEPLWGFLRQSGALRMLYSQWVIEGGDGQSDNLLQSTSSTRTRE